MNSDRPILDVLLGLTRVSWSDPRAALTWKYPLPMWVWVLIVAGAIVAAAWSYRRMLGPRWARSGLGLLRVLLLVFIAALLAGPMLVISQEVVEPDWLFMLVDRSASMTIRDMNAGTNAAATTAPSDTAAPPHERLVVAHDPKAGLSRDEALRRALAAHAGALTEKGATPNRRVVWLGFDSTTYEIDPPVTSGDEPTGQATLLRTALEQTLQRGAGRPIAGIVLFTDGRSPQATGSDLVRRLEQEAVGVFVVPLGRENAPLELTIAQVESPDKAFINDAVPVTVQLDRPPDGVTVDPQRVVVRLIDEQTGKVLDQRSPTDGSFREPVRLAGQSATVGPIRWRVEVGAQGQPPAATQPLAAMGGQRKVEVEMIDRPLRVLYIEGYPRWDYRYLKNLLLREKTIQSSILLASADRAFAQEGSMPITRMPQTADELRPFDAVIIGDVPSGYFSAQELALIRQHVSARGGGLLWMAGPNDTPRSYEATALAGLLPMKRPSMVDRADPTLGAMQVHPTALASSLSILRLRTGGSGNAIAGTTNDDAAASAGWPSQLPSLEWVQDLGELKPIAEPLAQTYGHPGKPLPVVVRMRFGAGQSVYVASDETWRWRYARGDLYFDQFWVQLIRMLGRTHLEQGGQRASLALSSRRVDVDAPVVLTVRITDELLAQRDLPRIAVSVLRVDGDKPPTEVERVELPRKPAAAIDPALSEANKDLVYEGLWRPGSAGRFILRVSEAALDDLNVTQTLEAQRSDDELRQRLADHARLEALASDTGGKILALDKVGDLPSMIPSRARRTPSDLREPLGESYLALILALTLLTAEWIGRKLARLA